jgi:hypothetical protein
MHTIITGATWCGIVTGEVVSFLLLQSRRRHLDSLQSSSLLIHGTAKRYHQEFVFKSRTATSDLLYNIFYTDVRFYVCLIFNAKNLSQEIKLAFFGQTAPLPPKKKSLKHCPELRTQFVSIDRYCSSVGALETLFY